LEHKPVIEKQPATSPLTKAIIPFLILLMFSGGFFLSQLILKDGDTDPENSQPQAPATADASGVGLVNPPMQVTDFSLMSDEGETVNLSDLRGKVVLLFFGYTNCPDVCPTTLAELKTVKQKLGADSEEIEVVFISVDPQRDNPQVVADYLSHFDSDFIGLIGDEAILQKIGPEYGLVFSPETINVNHDHEHEDEGEDNHEVSNETYFVQHTSPVFLIDAEGYMRVVYFYGTSSSAMAQSILSVVRSGNPDFTGS
jgi:protein SCO1/2